MRSLLALSAVLLLGGASCPKPPTPAPPALVLDAAPAPGALEACDVAVQPVSAQVCNNYLTADGMQCVACVFGTRPVPTGGCAGAGGVYCSDVPCASNPRCHYHATTQ